MLTYAPCPTCGRNLHPLEDRLWDHAACFKAALNRCVSKTAAPCRRIRSIFECDRCGVHLPVQTEGAYAGRTDLCPGCASGDNQRRDVERAAADAAWRAKQEAALMVDRTCGRCGASYHFLTDMTYCPGCHALFEARVMCCEKARYAFTPGDPCGFRVCEVHGTRNVEPVD
jgi:hypothetical protein